MAYRILRTWRARQDLLEIAEYSSKRWGRRQMAKYLRELDATIQKLATGPLLLGQDRSYLKPGLRSLPHKKLHFIFYRVNGDAVEIIRVLHQRRDWARLVEAP